MHPPDEYRIELMDSRRQIRAETLTSGELNRLTEEWKLRIQPTSNDCDEQFAVTLPDGTTTGVQGCRWLFHLLGIPHRAAHIGLATPSGLVLLQRRSPSKNDNPDLWDLSVTGHVSGEDGYLKSAMREIAEELGLEAIVQRKRDETGQADLDVRCLLAGNTLYEVGLPRADPPELSHRWWHCNVEVRQVYAGTLTAEALAAIHPQESELAGIYLCSPAEAWRLHTDETRRRDETGEHSTVWSPGGYSSLPYYLAWLERH